MKTTTAAAVLCLLAAQSNAEIKEDGLWTGEDWYHDFAVLNAKEQQMDNAYQEKPLSFYSMSASGGKDIYGGEEKDEYHLRASNIGVKNGVPYAGYSRQDFTEWDRMYAAMTREWEYFDDQTHDYTERENVVRAMKFFSEKDFNYVFAMTHKDYTYEGLMKAISKYPSFCAFDNNWNGKGEDYTCKRELATIFAHFTQETGGADPNNKKIEEWRQGLVHITEAACTDKINVDDKCDYIQKDKVFKNNLGEVAYPADPNNEGVQYYGRGPLQISWNYNYGAFSKVLNEQTGYDASSDLLEDPDDILFDSETMFFSALWFYMTPQSPKPSMHDVTTGRMEPTWEDKSFSLGANFGTTIAIINGAKECGKKAEHPKKAEKRGEYYKAFLKYFKLDAETDDSLSCAEHSQFPQDGWGTHMHYFDKDWSLGETKCKEVHYQTAYSAYTRGDYKRCICDSHGNGELDCGSAGRL